MFFTLTYRIDFDYITIFNNFQITLQKKYNLIIKSSLFFLPSSPAFNILATLLVCLNYEVRGIKKFFE